jgi:hypothetical protein
MFTELLRQFGLLGLQGLEPCFGLAGELCSAQDKVAQTVFKRLLLFAVQG